MPISIDTGSADTDGRLVLSDGRLVAVLVCLADSAHADVARRWFLEAGFGALSGEEGLFRTLEDAVEWIRQRLAPAG